MGRAGSGSRSRSRSSGGHRSSSRRSSGHRSSSSSRRAGSSSYSSSSLSSAGRVASSIGRSSYGGYHRSSSGGSLNFSAFVMVACILLLIAFGMYLNTKHAAKPVSTIARTKLENVPIYDFNVVTDEIDYVEEEFTVGAGLKAFYEKTGIQPYVYFKAYDSSLITDEEKDVWAEEYFDSKGFNENVFSFVYFEESNPDDVGYMSVVLGYDTITVFDSEALDIFWNYWDNEWYGSGTTEDVVINAFTRTGNAIMKVSETQKTANSHAVIVLAGMVSTIVMSFVIVILVRSKAKKAEQEIRKAEANAKILSAPLERMEKENDKMDEYK